MNYFRKKNFRPSFLFRKMVIKTLFLFCCLFFSTLSIDANESQTVSKITIEFKNQSLESALNKLEKQSGYLFFYEDNVVKESSKINQKFEDKTISQILDVLFANSANSYAISGRQVIIYKKSTTSTANTMSPRQTPFTVKGVVVDESSELLIGATIHVEGSNIGTVTDDNGAFTVLTNDIGAQLIVSYMGYKPKIVKIRDAGLIRLEPNTLELKDMVVTGMFERTAESFTGSVTTLSNKDLARVGNQNVLQSLKLLDPSVHIPDNLTMGSDPNSMPTISMRGTSSLPLTETNSFRSKYQNQPNQPLFILDGFETSVENIVDLDMNRVESMTILRDASAKAMYGSKAANGVIVIETKRVEGNQQLVTYNGSISLEVPDLNSYNLTNSLEKLDVELAEGLYTSSDDATQAQLTQLYNSRKKLAMEGFDTYWLSKPLRTGVGQKHNISLELGDSRSLRAYLDMTYNQVDGVMKDSYRRNISGSANISYRKNSLLFRNIFTILSNKGQASPYGDFSAYTVLNPYWRATDENGQILRWASIDGQTKVANPLYDGTIGTSLVSTYLEFINNFETEWRVNPDLKATLRIGISNKRNDADSFYPALHSKFANYLGDNLVRRGSYTMENGKNSSVSGDFALHFNKSFDKHSVFAVGRAEIASRQYEGYEYSAEGFSNNQTADITFARQFALGTTPNGISGINREASFLISASYDYDTRYTTDVTVRQSASSLYGADKRWANSWSFGLGWNLHNEGFFKGVDPVKFMKLRGSVGTTGNQKFNTNESIATYKYNTNVVYGGITGSYLSNMANPYLQWEQKKDYDMGLDLKIYGLNLTFDYYVGDTKNLLTDVTTPTSTGFSTVKGNLGAVRNTGIEAKVNYTVWQNNKGFLNIYGTLSHNKNKVVNLSESLKDYNTTVKEQTKTSRPLTLYEDGYSMNTLWVVPSAGIDPATGREIFIKKDGTYTYTHSNDDLVAIGDQDPKFRGTLGFTAEYSGIGVNATLSYWTGGKMYNYTLVQRVDEADISYNVDQRVFLGRWQTPGQVTQFKKFQADQITYPTSRFVQDRKELSISSLSVYYEVPSSFYEKLKMKRLRLTFYMNDVATFSSIKIERGLSYPFARNMSLQLTGTF